MRRQPFLLGFSTLVVALALAGCGGNNNSKTSTPTATTTRVAASAVGGTQATTIAGGASGASSGGAAGTAAAGRTPSPRNTAVVEPSAGCAALTSGPAGTPVAAQPATPEPPFAPGPQPVRPAVDFGTLTVNPSYIPPGFKSLDSDRPDPVKISATDIASSTANPQATLAHLNNIGFLGGRQQGWTGPTVQGRIPTIYVLDLAFSTDAGASEFLRNPPFGATICAKPVPGPQIGQEALHVFYQYETPGNVGPADGYSLYWRCGRVVLGVNNSSAPGQATQGTVDDLARKIQADFIKSQPCS